MVAFSLYLICVSIGLYTTMIAAFCLTMRRVKEPLPEALAANLRVSILKPLSGTDDELQANLESFSRLELPRWELLLGVVSSDNTALETACCFVRAYPHLNVRIVLTDPRAAPNPKVAQLIVLERAARGQILVVSDSNVRMFSRALRHLLQELTATKTALVSSVFLGTGEHTLGAFVENLHLSTYVAPGMVASWKVAQQPLSVGKSMAMWRHALQQVGGFGGLKDVLAEDHLLGQRMKEAGYGVRVCVTPVENRVVTASLDAVWSRHARWATIRRLLAPGLFFFEPFLSPLVMATFMFLLCPCRELAAVLLGAIALQSLGAHLCLVSGRRRSMGWNVVPLEVTRTYLLFSCWLRAWFSSSVVWRGHALRLGAGSRILPPPPSTVRPASMAFKA